MRRAPTTLAVLSGLLAIYLIARSVPLKMSQSRLFASLPMLASLPDD